MIKPSWGALAAGTFAALFLAAGIGLFWFGVPVGVDMPSVLAFAEGLPQKVERADAVVAGERVLSLGRERTVSLYHVDEVLKGGELIAKVMEAYPDVPGTVIVAYTSEEPLTERREPRGKSILFMTGPLEPGKNLRLLNNDVDEGMVSALPWLVRRTRALCRR